MSDDDMPTTKEVRDRFWINDGAWADPDDAEAFDRWLSAHDAEVAAATLRDAAADVRVRGDVGVEGGPTVDGYLTGRAGMLERNAEEGSTK